MACSLAILPTCQAAIAVSGLHCTSPASFSEQRWNFNALSSWTIRNGDGPYGEIDLLEGFSDISTAYTTLHTDPSSTCTFSPPADQETGTSNQNSTNCASSIGCSVIGEDGSYGTSFNDNGGGVYAMEWTSDLINIYFFPRDAIPADITSGNPDPSGWGLPTANFESQYGNCDIDANFPAQTIVRISSLTLIW